MQRFYDSFIQKYQIYNQWRQTKHHNKIYLVVLVVFTLLVFSLIFNFSDKIYIQADTTAPQRTFKMGVGAIPKNFPNPTTEDFLDMFSKTKESGELLLWQTDWRDGDYKSGDNIIPKYLQLIGDQKYNYGYEPALGINFYNIVSGNAEALLNLNSAYERQQYKEVAIEIAKTYKPKYLILGVEVNTFYLLNPNEFPLFTTLYAETYNAVKAVSPDTKVFVTFQLEQMKGIASNAWPLNTKPQWELINMFGNYLDLVAFTTYPQIKYNLANEIPDNYYGEINNYTNKTITFTESGWSSDKETILNPRQFTEQEQKDFLSRFIDLLKPLRPEFIIWSFLHDIQQIGQAGSPFTSIGLKKNDGVPKLSWSLWTQLKSMSLFRFASLPSDAEILFVSTRDTGSRRKEIYSMNSNGSNQNRISFTDESRFIIGMDSSKRYLVDSRMEKDTNEPIGLGDEDKRALWIIDLETKEEKRLTDLNNKAEGDSFSPDGEWIVFLMVVSGDSQADIYKIKKDGTGLTNLTNTETASEGDPTWSNDGKEIVFSSIESIENNIRAVLKKMDINGNNVTTVYDGGYTDAIGPFPSGNYDPFWSPDDEWIVFGRSIQNMGGNWGSGIWHIFKVKKDGSEVTDLSIKGNHTNRGEYLPSFSPDGKFIVFGSLYEDANPEKSHNSIFVMDSNTGEIINKLTDDVNSMFPFWIKTIQQPYEKINIIGENASKGVFDPSLEHDENGVIWMVYTAIEMEEKGNNHFTNLAKSEDGGKTWQFIAKINDSPMGEVTWEGKKIFGNWRNEVATLVDDKDDPDPSKRWKLFWHKYFMKAPFGENDRLAAGFGWIAYKYAASPAALAQAKEIRLFGNYPAPLNPADGKTLYPVKHYLNRIDQNLEGFLAFTEPGSLVKDGRIYLSMQSVLPDFEKTQTFLISSKDHGNTWQYHGVLLNENDAKNLNTPTLVASSLFEENNRTFILASPVTPKGMNGILVFEFENIAEAKLKRDSSGNLITVKHIEPYIEGEFSGCGDYDAKKTYGGFLICATDVLKAIEKKSMEGGMQIFDTREKIDSATDTTAPSIPTNLTATAISSSQINLSWTASTDPAIAGQAISGVAGYKIYRNGQLVNSQFVNLLMYNDTGLTASTTYAYAVSAYDTSGNESGKSAIVSATTQSLEDTIPPAISNISVSNITQTSITINWITNEPATSQIEYGLTTSYNLETATTFNYLTSHSITLTALSANTTYHYRINVQDQAGNSALSVDHTFNTQPLELPYPNGSLLKTEDNDKIYFIVNNKKRWLINPEVFISYGLIPHSQITVPKGILDQYEEGKEITKPSHSEGTLVRASNDFKVYIIKPPFKRHIFNPAIFNMYKHFNWNSIKEIDQDTLNSYITSDLYRAVNDPKVFSLEEVDEAKGLAKKRWLDMTPEDFVLEGYSWNQVFVINPRERDYYQEGEVINSDGL